VALVYKKGHFNFKLIMLYWIWRQLNLFLN